MQDKTSLTPPGDAKYMQIPQLGLKPDNKEILVAAYGGEFEKLDNLLKDGKWPNAELKEYILLYLLNRESENKSQGKRCILNKHDVLKCLVQKGANIKPILALGVDFETIKAIAAGN